MEQDNNNKIKKILELSKKANEANCNEDYALAAKCFKEIIEVEPGFEFGDAYFCLGIALEQIGNLSEAESAYLKALEYDPEDIHRLGNYASFLYLHRAPEKAFEVYLKLLDKEREIADCQAEASSLEQLFELGEKMGWSKEEIQKAIDEA